MITDQRRLLETEIVVNDTTEFEDRVIIDLAKTSTIKVFTKPSTKVENYSEKDAEPLQPSQRKLRMMPIRASTRRVSRRLWRL